MASENTEREKVLERVRRFLALADKDKNTSVGEAELAAERAQKLILKFQIEESEIKDFSGEEIVRITINFTGLESSNYGKMLIVESVANLNSVIVLFNQINKSRIKPWVTLVGFASDVEFVKQISEKVLDAASGEVARLINAKAHAHSKPSDFRHWFYYGVSTRLKKRFSSLLDMNEFEKGAIVLASKMEIVDKKLQEQQEVETVRLETPQHSIAGYKFGQAFAESATFDKVIN